MTYLIATVLQWVNIQTASLNEPKWNCAMTIKCIISAIYLWCALLSRDSCRNSRQENPPKQSGKEIRLMEPEGSLLEWNQWLDHPRQVKSTLHTPSLLLSDRFNITLPPTPPSLLSYLNVHIPTYCLIYLFALDLMAVNEVITLDVYAVGMPAPTISTVRVQAHSAAPMCKYYIFLFLD